MDSETDKNKPETPYKFCATTFLAAAGILLGATSALSAFLGNNLSKVIGVFLDDNLSIEETALILTATVFCLMFVAGFVVSTILFIHCIKPDSPCGVSTLNAMPITASILPNF